MVAFKIHTDQRTRQHLSILANRSQLLHDYRFSGLSVGEISRKHKISKFILRRRIQEQCTSFFQRYTWWFDHIHTLEFARRRHHQQKVVPLTSPVVVHFLVTCSSSEENSDTDTDVPFEDLSQLDCSSLLEKSQESQSENNQSDVTSDLEEGEVSNEISDISCTNDDEASKDFVLL